MLTAYRQHAAERAALGIPPLPLDAQQTAELIELIADRDVRAVFPEAGVSAALERAIAAERPELVEVGIAPGMWLS